MTLEHRHVPGPAEGYIIPNGIDHKNGLVEGFVDHRKTTGISDDEDIKPSEKRTILSLKVLDHCRIQVTPRCRVDVIGDILFPLEHPCVCREAPVSYLNIRTVYANVFDD